MADVMQALIQSLPESPGLVPGAPRRGEDLGPSHGPGSEELPGSWSVSHKTGPGLLP